MRLVLKLALAFFVATCTVMLVHAWLSARASIARLEDNVSTDLRALGADLRDWAAMTWRTEGADVAKGAVSTIHRGDVRVTFEEAIVDADSVRITSTGDAREVVGSFPIVIDGVPKGSLTVRRLVPTRALWEAEIRGELEAGLVLVAIEGLLVFVLSGWLIGAPLRTMVAQTERIGSGDLTTRLALRRRDELGVLAGALDAMADRLREAKERAEEEATARLQTLERLRHLDRLRTVGMLSSSVAHELGTPLNIVLIRAQELVAAERTETVEAGRAILAQVDRMSARVRQLLDFARKDKRDRKKVRTIEVVKRSCALLDGLARKASVKLESGVLEDISVEGDAAQLEQALSNLIVNAIHAMPRGGVVRLEVRREANAGASYACISVHDDGIGMPAEVLARLFEPFFTTKPAGSGTGLGLTVASGIAEDHGGFIRASSEEGKGSTFQLYVPEVST